MRKIDHVINSIRSHLEPRVDDFVKEWKSGKYKKISDCPSYYEVKLLTEAINHISKDWFEEKQALTPREIIEFYVEENNDS